MSRQTKALIFTANNWCDEDLEHLLSTEWIEYGVVGKEVSSTGTPHLQGYVVIKKRTGKVKACKDLTALFKNHAHVQCAKGSTKQNKTYCSKEGDWQEWGEMPVSGKRTDILKMHQAILDGKTDEELALDLPVTYYKYYKAAQHVRNVLKAAAIGRIVCAEFDKAILRDWQKIALQKLVDQNDRKVLWVVDMKGNTGKSWFAKWLEVKKNAYYVTGGRKTDLAHAYQFQEIVVFDLSRSTEEFLNYDVIENFKNGRVFSGKYESAMKRMPACKVLVLSNWCPDLRKLSEDRWEIMNLMHLDMEYITESRHLEPASTGSG